MDEWQRKSLDRASAVWKQHESSMSRSVRRSEIGKHIVNLHEERIAYLEAENTRLRALLPDAEMQITIGSAVATVFQVLEKHGSQNKQILTQLTTVQLWLDKLESEGQL